MATRTPVSRRATSTQSPAVFSNNALKSVVAYVEVRSECEDISDSISHFLHLLGATVSKHFNRKVTHVVFKNGKHSTYKKAVEWGVHLVSVSWIERCKESKSIAPEKDFPAIVPEQYTSPFCFEKPKKFKSMVPRLTEIDVTKSLKRREQQRQRRRIKKECDALLAMSPSLHAKIKPQIVFNNEKTSNEEENNRVKRRRKSSSDTSIDLSDEITTEESPWNIPLAERLLNKSLSKSLNETPHQELVSSIKNLSLKTDKGKRKLFPQTDPTLLNFTPETPRCKAVRNSPFKQPMESSSFNSSDSSLSDFQLTANKENEVKVRKLIMQFDESPSLPKPQKTPVSVKQMSTKERRRSARLLSPNVISRMSPSLVLTSVNKQDDMDTLNSVIAGLGGYRIVLSVDETTTHVVCGIPRRTLSVLFGLARGCWILSIDWVFKSLEKGSWLPEIDFELSNDFPTSRVCRIEREKSAAYKQNIFQDAGIMFIGENIQMPKKMLHQLIQLCGGRTVNQRKAASIYIGCGSDGNDDCICLSEKWILDSITNNELQPVDDFVFTD